MMMNGKLPTARTFLMALVLSALLYACGSKISQENFDKIKSGMTEEEVTSLLGKPSESSSMSLGSLSGGSSVWKDKQGAITIQFANGKVMSKQFSKEAAK